MLDAAPVQQHDGAAKAQPVGKESHAKCQGEAMDIYGDDVPDRGVAFQQQTQPVRPKEDESTLTTAQSSLSWLSSMVIPRGLWPSTPRGLQTNQETRGQLASSSLGAGSTPEIAMSDFDGVVPSNHLSQDNETPSPPSGTLPCNIC